MLERNRRVAKAYARAPVITVNGSTDGFDGFRIGVAGFDNPLRDSNTSAAIQALGLGLKLKMDDVGNVLVKRISRYVILVIWLFLAIFPIFKHEYVSSRAYTCMSVCCCCCCCSCSCCQS